MCMQGMGAMASVDTIVHAIHNCVLVRDENTKP